MSTEVAGGSQGDAQTATERDEAAVMETAVTVGENQQPEANRVSARSDHQEVNDTQSHQSEQTGGTKEPLKPHQPQVAVSRKRTPSPTMLTGPPTKRPNLESSLTAAKRPSLEVNSKPILSKPPTPLLGPLTSRLGSSASRVLTEEFQRKQGQENSKLKYLIVKEIRKPGKSESIMAVHVLFTNSVKL